MASAATVVDITNAIVRIATVTVVIIFVFRTWTLVKKGIKKLEKVLSERKDAQKEKEEEEKREYWDEAQHHLDTTISCKNKDTKTCIKEALMHPIQFKFTMNSNDLREVPYSIASQDSKVDLGSGDDFWLNKGADT